MQSASAHIYTVLKEKGYRVTGPRKKIIEALLTASSPKTAKEIAQKTKIKDFSTVYRTLGEFKREGLLQEFTDRAVAYYELSSHHHDHAVCDGCGVMVHIPCTNTKAPQALTGWKALSHEVLWRGRCRICA
jgi:Fe2+ or Zn2+ uptake regulation protein